MDEGKPDPGAAEPHKGTKAEQPGRGIDDHHRSRTTYSPEKSQDTLTEPGNGEDGH